VSVDLDLFAGPGGWDVAAGALGMAPVGIELDAAACATRAAAGHPTIRYDVADFPAEFYAGEVRGLIGSPVCTTFSAAGKRAGTAVLDVLEAMILDLFEGGKTRAAHRREMARMLRLALWPDAKLTRAERSARIRKAVLSASLVAEPARFIYACRPEWVALEQVPAVLPLWQAYAAELRRAGYSAWTGKLNAADYGVPQTRERAVLIASRAHQVSRPEPTHYDPRRGMQLWGTPWVSMAEALGWGATARPAPTATAGGTATGGAEPFGHRDRDALTAEQDAGRWQLRRNRGAGFLERGGPRRDHPPSEPAPTITGGDTGIVRLSWVHERPSTTVQGDPRIGRPGHKDRDKGESQFAVDSVRISVEEAAIIQSFPPDYPWQGNKTARYTQVGNAVPPLLAEHILAMATGIQRLERAA